MTCCKENRRFADLEQGTSIPAAVCDSPLGLLTLWWGPGGVVGLAFGEPSLEVHPQTGVRPWIAWLEAYFRDPMDCGPAPPMAARGTPFQQRVWRALCHLPPGRVLTYGEMARCLGTGARPLGGACRANPCPILVPCHRVVARRGLGGYAGGVDGERLGIKRWLLQHEGALPHG